jgi:twitching motility protein PilT
VPFIDLSQTSPVVPTATPSDATQPPVVASAPAPLEPIEPPVAVESEPAAEIQAIPQPQVEFHPDGVRVISGPELTTESAVPTPPLEPVASEPAVDVQTASPLPIRASSATVATPIVETAPVEESHALEDVLDRDLPLLPPETQLQELEREVSAMQIPALTTTSNTDLEGQTYSLDDLLVQTVNLGASDLHLTANYRAMARVDGKLQMIRSQVLTHDSIKAMLTPIAKRYPEVDIDRDRDLDLAYQLHDGTRFRVNIGYQQQTMTGTFRLIPSVIKTPQELHLPALVTQFTKYKQGLVLVTGPTGSGKSTTLAALVNEINKTEAKHIITIEDPIEYAYPKGSSLVDQRNVGVDTLSWPMALRATLRQDPDVVLIGEMRDIETMEAALQVAETGHLVFSTLHTNTAAQTIDRVIDAFPKGKQEQVRTQLSSVLMAVISQRLIPIAGGGRRLAVEVMVVTGAIRNAIREGKVFQIDNMIQTGGEYGMITLEKSLAQLVRDGLISVELAQLNANKPEEILTILGRS